MNEKIKNGIEKAKEKGKEFVEKNKVALGFAVGAVVAVAGFLIGEKLDEPKSGCIEFDDFTGPYGDVTGRIFYKNRFGIEKNPLNIGYQSDGEDIRKIYDQIDGLINKKKEE